MRESRLEIGDEIYWTLSGFAAYLGSDISKVYEYRRKGILERVDLPEGRYYKLAAGWIVEYRPVVVKKKVEEIELVKKKRRCYNLFSKGPRKSAGEGKWLK